MAPKSPWKKTATTKDHKKNDHLLMPTKHPVPAAATAIHQTEDMGSIDYDEVQSDEISALEAIFMEDYQQVEIKSAWSNNTDKAFKLTLRTFADQDTFVVLSVRLTATYPKTPPILHLESLDRLHASAQDKIKEIVRDKPADLLGEAMIHSIATDIQDVLEDAVLAREKGVLPSLEDERMKQEATMEQRAKEAEAEEARRYEAAQAEQDEHLDRMLQVEIERQNKRRTMAARASEQETLDDDEPITDSDIRFDQKVVLSPHADTAPFTIVSLVSTISAKGDTGLFAAQPKINGRLGLAPEMLAVRRLRLSFSTNETATRLDLTALEEELAVLKRLRQPNMVSVYAFRIEKVDHQDNVTLQERDITVLTELGNRGSMAEMLEDVETISLPKARQWSLDLLEALHFYHRHGIVHKRIHTNNVLFFRSTTGVLTPKLSDAAYQDRLLRLQGRLTKAEKDKKMAAWLAPELVGPNPNHTRRSDIWDFGVLLVQMLFGISATRKYSSPTMLRESMHLSTSLDDVLHQVFRKEGKDRPTAFDLIPSEFFRTDDPIMMVEHSTSSRPRPSSRSHALSGSISPVLRRSRHNSQGMMETPSISRYGREFVELGRLGKGGFGEVVKARNRTDGGVYAIKKIKQASRAALQQVLSEASVLRRLNHPYVVRYFTAWVETGTSGENHVHDQSMADSFTETGDSRTEFGLSSHGLDFANSQSFNIEFGSDSDEDSDTNSQRTEDDEDDQNSSDEDGNDTEGEDSDFGNFGANQSENRHRRERSRSFLESEESSEHASEGSLSTSRSLGDASAGTTRPITTTLYIQMEYCEKKTLRDLIQKDLHQDLKTVWKMVRQIVEGLAHIHEHGIIHRDLKPDNVFIDMSGNSRIGDFGLATTSRQQIVESMNASLDLGEEMTRSIGTAMYAAPEIKSGGGDYNEKVDMYSLGIIFFEMCYPLSTAMERHHVLLKLRERDHILPPEFNSDNLKVQGTIISSLIKHAPSERPSSQELLRSGKIPPLIKDETFQQDMDLEDETTFYAVLSALFANTDSRQVMMQAYLARYKPPRVSEEELLIRELARVVLYNIFETHLAIEVDRSVHLFGLSRHYASQNVVRLLDPTGTLLQLPWDLVLPNAIQLAKEGLVSDLNHKTYCFGTVYRDTLNGGPPKTLVEADFDIATPDLEVATLYEAECMKAVSEIVYTIPALSAQSMCFHLSHSNLVDIIFDFCRIEKPQRAAVAECLSKLNIQGHNWTKVRAEIRSDLLGVHSTSLDDLELFGFRETPNKIHAKLMSMLGRTKYAARIKQPLEHLLEVAEIMKNMGVDLPVYISPLSCHNIKLYRGGILFQCIRDGKNRGVFAVGGRYDYLIEEYHVERPDGPMLCHAVGVCIGYEAIVASMMKYKKGGVGKGQRLLKKLPFEPSPSHLQNIIRVSGKPYKAKRLGKTDFYIIPSIYPYDQTLTPIKSQSEVLVASTNPKVLRTMGGKVLGILYDAGISARVATSMDTIDDPKSRKRHRSYSWIVFLKHDPNIIKIRNLLTDTETEIPMLLLVDHLKKEIKQRETQLRMEASRQPAALQRTPSNHPDDKVPPNVQILAAQHKSKKSNKFSMITDAQHHWQKLLTGLQSAPILAIELKDDVLKLISQTRLSDGESWRRAIQSVPVSDRQYLGQAQEVLLEHRRKWTLGEGPSLAGVYNFRSASCIYYDLAA